MAARGRSPRWFLVATIGVGLSACSKKAAEGTTIGDSPNAGGASFAPSSSGGAPGISTGSGGAIVSPGGVAGGIDSGSSKPIDAGPSRGPTPPMPGVNFPFPQNRETANCIYPSGYRNEDVTRAFQQWKTDTVTADGAGGHLRVQRPNDRSLAPNSTVSEGIGYGMLIAVYMNDQELFDELWKYERLWLDGSGLMNWYIDATGTMVLGGGAATDADEDMAYALVMADKQWGGQGTLDQSYLAYAKDQIERFWNSEIYQGKLARAGDQWGDWSNVNISYFAPAYYRVFSQIDGNTDGWNAVLKTVYDTMDNAQNAMNGNTTNGLVPAWCTSMGMPGSPGNYQYDSCRTPFRIGLDWCFFGTQRAHDYVAKTSAFFAGVGANSIVDGYGLDGTPQPAHPGGRSAAFIGPATVGAMSDGTFQAFVNDGYASVRTGTLLVGGTYYDESWTVLSLLMMTGNFLDYTAY